MPLTPAEKQKKYREKLKKENPEKYNDMKKKASERALKHYREKIQKYTEKDKEQQRLKWKEERKKAKELQNKTQNSNQSEEQKTKAIKLIQLHRKITTKLRKENQELRSETNILKKKLEAMRKKLYRQKKKIVELNEKYNNALKIIEEMTSPKLNMYDTPNKTTDKFVEENLPEVDTPHKETVKKKILELNVLTESLKSEYMTSKSNDQKNILKNIVNNDIVKKYNLKSKMTANLGLKTNMRKYRDKKLKNTLLQHKVRAFYERDDVSRATAGKKECKTFKKLKKQKRYLLDSMKNLHKKYMQEVGKISLSAFKMYRPFYVVPPKLENRDTCACLKHANMKFMVHKLKSLGYIVDDDLNSLVSEVVCDPKSKDCMYSMCVCSEKTVKGSEVNLMEKITWPVWTVEKHEYVKDDKVKFTNRMAKTEMNGTVQDLINIFNKQMPAFKKHVYNVFRQYQEYKTCISNLQDNEAVIHIDFSENYVCKLHEEVQSMHFGSAKSQITLHTGVLYMKDEKPISFCSISPSNLHNPESIWAHLDPVLKSLKSKYPNITLVHFFSDGPTSQYRQKKNFYLFSKKIYEYGFEQSTWSFFEAAHGKGAADGIGGAIKRALDERVAHGIDIPNAETAFEVLSASDTTIKLFYISPDEINLLDSKIVNNLIPCPNTMQIHQLTTNEKYIIKYREVSCFCSNKKGMCDCDNPKIHNLIKKGDQITATRKRQSNEQRIKKQRHIGKKPKKSRSSDIDTDTSIDSHITYAETDVSDTWLKEDDEDEENVNLEIGKIRENTYSVILSENNMGEKEELIFFNAFDEVTMDRNTEEVEEEEMEIEKLDIDDGISLKEKKYEIKEEKTQKKNRNIQRETHHGNSYSAILNKNDRGEKEELKNLNASDKVTLDKSTKEVEEEGMEIEKLDTDDGVSSGEEKFRIKKDETQKKNKYIQRETQIPDSVILSENNMGEKEELIFFNAFDEVTMDRNTEEVEEEEMEIEKLDIDDGISLKEKKYEIKEEKTQKKNRNIQRETHHGNSYSAILNKNDRGEKEELKNLNASDKVTLDKSTKEVEEEGMEIEKLDTDDGVSSEEEKFRIKKDETQKKNKYIQRETQIPDTKVSIVSNENVTMVLDAETGLFKLNRSESCHKLLDDHCAEIGKYILANFYTKKGKSTYRYVCLIEGVDEFSDKLVVKGLKSIKGDKKKFKLIEKDISIISKEDILMFLPHVDADCNGYVTFPNEINVKEQP